MENQKTCPSCGATFPAETKFCTCCGTRLPDAQQPEPVKMMFCFNCGAKIPADAAVCPNCGTPQKLKKKRMRRQHPGLKRAVAAVLAVAALAGCALGVRTLIGKGGKTADYIVYAKDGELMYSSTKKLEPIQLTKRLCTDGRDNIDFEYFGDIVRVSSDGKKILYPDRCAEGPGVTLYCRDLSRNNTEPVKIDTEITEFYVAKDFSSVHYLKGDDGLLYRYDFKEKEKIASGVQDIYASEDGKTVVFRNDSGNAYYKRTGKDKEKIGRADWLNQVSADASSVIYRGEDGAFYRWQKDAGRSKLPIEGYIEYLNTDGKGFISNSNEPDVISLTDLIVDDMVETDAGEMPAMAEPHYSDYENISDYEKAYEEYASQKESSEAKEYREYLRSAAVNAYSSTLFYFDGEQTIELSDSVFNVWGSAEDELGILYTEYNTDDPTLKISEIPTGRDTSSILDDVKKKLVYARGDQLYTVAEVGNLSRAGISGDGTMLYYLYYDEDQVGDLMKAKITSKGVEEPELVDSDASSAMCVRNQLYYYKFTEDDEIELYCDGLLLDKDVNSRTADDTHGKLAYFADWNTNRDEGTLKLTDGKKSVMVSEDVSSFIITPNGGLAYLTDYSRSREEGTLYFYNGKKSVLLDSDVEYVYYPRTYYYCYCGHIGY